MRKAPLQGPSPFNLPPHHSHPNVSEQEVSITHTPPFPLSPQYHLSPLNYSQEYPGIRETIRLLLDLADKPGEKQKTVCKHSDGLLNIGKQLTPTFPKCSTYGQES